MWSTCSVVKCVYVCGPKCLAVRGPVSLRYHIFTLLEGTPLESTFKWIVRHRKERWARMAEKKAHKYSQIHGNQAQLTSSFDV